MDFVLKIVFDMINRDNWKLLNHNRHLFHWRVSFRFFPSLKQWVINDVTADFR